MTRFICTKSETKDVPVGTELVGTKVSELAFVLVRDSDLLIPRAYSAPVPKFNRGERLPFRGELWSWAPLIKD